MTAPARPFRPRPVDWTKPLRTRSGLKARLLGKLEGDRPFPYVVAIMGADGAEWKEDHRPSGDWGGENTDSLDLENAPEVHEIEVFVNLYRTYAGDLVTSAHDTKEGAEGEINYVYDTSLVVAHRITATVEIP